jgi:hypothetical protein
MAAKPDCDDGWLKYAHELDAALAVADFTKGARIVLREVFSQIFGPAKLRHARLSPAEIGGRVGMARPHVMRGITELVDSGVLARSADGAYKFIKDYESWTYKGARRLSEAEVVYCHSAPRIALSYMHTPTQNALPNEVTHQQPPVTNLGNANVEMLPNEVMDVTQRGNGLLPNEVTDFPSPYRNGRELETLERINTIPPLPPEGGAVVVDEGSDPNPIRDPEQSGSVTPDPLSAAGLIDLARLVLGERGEAEDFGYQISGWLTAFPGDWIRDAILVTGAKATAIDRSMLASYALACLQRWRPHGPRGKDVQEVAAARRKYDRGGSPPAEEYAPVTDEDIEYVALRRQSERKKAEQLAKNAGRKPR